MQKLQSFCDITLVCRNCKEYSRVETTINPANIIYDERDLDVRGSLELKRLLDHLYGDAKMVRDAAWLIFVALKNSSYSVS